MSIQVLFFGELAEAAEAATGAGTMTLPFSDSCASLNQLQSQIAEAHIELKPILARGDHLRSVNQIMHHDDVRLKDGDEVAFMSPFSGG